MKAIKLLFSQFSFLHAIRFILLDAIRKLLCINSDVTYSQVGEDIIIYDILKSVSKGFYVEVGSNEPIQHSNTFKLYQKGWKGITIDANQTMVTMHKKIRVNDIALCAAVSDEEKDVTFYEFDMDEINTIDTDFYNQNKEKQRVSRTTTTRTQTLNSILSVNLPDSTSIDLLLIDVEGHDFQVLNSIDLRKHRPKLIIIEMHNFDLTNPASNSIYNRLVSNDYIFSGYAVWNGYFVSTEFNAIR